MKLYMNPLSPNVRRVQLAASALGIELEEHAVDFFKGEHKSPEFLALNPNGAVPTLTDGDLVLTESRAIMQYLASKKPESSLFPRAERSRAEVTRWQFWDAAHFSPHLVGTLVFEKMIKPMMKMGDPDARKIEEAIANFRRFAAVLDGVLAKRRFVAGNMLTLADLSVAATMMYAERTEAPVGEFPNLAAWFARMRDLDAWKKTEPVFPR